MIWRKTVTVQKRDTQEWEDCDRAEGSWTVAVSIMQSCCLSYSQHSAGVCCLTQSHLGTDRFNSGLSNSKSRVHVGYVFSLPNVHDVHTCIHTHMFTWCIVYTRAYISIYTHDFSLSFCTWVRCVCVCVCLCVCMCINININIRVPNIHTGTHVVRVSCWHSFESGYKQIAFKLYACLCTHTPGYIHA